MRWTTVGLIHIADVYHWYISDIFVRKYRIFFDIFYFYQVFKNIFNVTHCDYVLIFSPCVLLAYDLCPQHFLSVGQLLSDCTSPQQCIVNDKSTSPNMQCTYTHTCTVLLFGSTIFSNRALDVYDYEVEVGLLVGHRLVTTWCRLFTSVYLCQQAA